MRLSAFLLLAGLATGTSPAFAGLSDDMRKGGAELGTSGDAATEAGGDTYAAYEAKLKEADAISDKMPLTAPRVVFVQQKATALGDYDPRPGDTYKQSEGPVLSYVELDGVGFKEVEGLLTYGFHVKLTLRGTDGADLFHVDDYADLDTKTRTRRRDIFFNSSLGIKSVPPGTYGLELLFTDKTNGKTLTTKQTFKIVE